VGKRKWCHFGNHRSGKIALPKLPQSAIQKVAAKGKPSCAIVLDDDVVVGGSMNGVPQEKEN
jgi:hypothetical protein